MTEDEKTPVSAPRPATTPRSSPPLTKFDRPKRPYSSPSSEDGGPTGPEPTRYNDWERKGRVSDF